MYVPLKDVGRKDKVQESGKFSHLDPNRRRTCIQLWGKVGELAQEATECLCERRKPITDWSEIVAVR